MFHSIKIIKFLFIGIFIPAFITFAAAENEHHEPSGHGLSSHEDGHHGGVGGHHFPAHIVGVFLGGTDTDEETEFTVGLEYEYRFSEKWGLGAVGEHTPDGHKGLGVSVLLGALHYHIDKLRLSAGAGVEVIHSDSHHEQEEEELYRLGVAYDFEIGHSFALVPTVNIDFVDSKEIIVFGIVFSRHF